MNTGNKHSGDTDQNTGNKHSGDSDYPSQST